MSLPSHQDAEGGNGSSTLSGIDLSSLLLISPTCAIDGRHASNRTWSSQEDMDLVFGDSSAAFFSMYMKLKGREAIEKAERWDKCAAWLLLNVSCAVPCQWLH